MTSITIKGLSADVMQRLRDRARREGLSIGELALRLLERALDDERPSFLDAHDGFVQQHGALWIDAGTFAGLRSIDEGRTRTD